MTTALTTQDHEERSIVPQIRWTPDQIELIKRTICTGATDDQLKLFLYQAQKTGLDPLARQIYGIIRKGKLCIQSSIDAFRLTADRTKKYAGQLGPLWHDGSQWVDVWLQNTPPKAAKVGVLRKDFLEPVWAIALWDEYKQEFNGQLGDMWRKMPALMLAKCAEALALRKAFPAELSGVYTHDEMAQADNQIETPLPQTPTTPASAPEVLPPSSTPSGNGDAPAWIDEPAKFKKFPNQTWRDIAEAYRKNPTGDHGNLIIWLSKQIDPKTGKPSHNTIRCQEIIKWVDSDKTPSPPPQGMDRPSELQYKQFDARCTALKISVDDLRKLMTNLVGKTDVVDLDAAEMAEVLKDLERLQKANAVDEGQDDIPF